MRMIASGNDQLSYWAARTRNTNTVPRANTMPAVLPARICWSDSSVQANSIPAGRIPCPSGGGEASASMRAIASPELIPGNVEPVMSAEGRRLKWLTTAGPLESVTVTSVESGTISPAELRTWSRPMSSRRMR